MTGELHDPTRPIGYEILVRGHLGDLLLHAFPELEPETCGGDTILRGALPDQAALHGVLVELEALGIELLALHRVSMEPGNPRDQRKNGDGGGPQEERP